MAITMQQNWGVILVSSLYFTVFSKLSILTITWKWGEYVI